MIHRLPAQPLYLRARIGRLLEEAGAVPLKRSVYVLPERRAAAERLKEVASEARAGGGEAFVAVASFPEPGVDRLLTEQFREARRSDWERLAGELDAVSLEDPAMLRAPLRRLRREADRIAAIDFFPAAGSREVRRRLVRLEKQLRRGPVRPPARRGQRRVWTTRRGIQIDRIASAWFIRRFLDPLARFRFVDPKEPRREGEVRFDMPEGDFTHDEDRCTFETLVRHAKNRDPAVKAVAEIVHDLDLGDGKFARPEAPGVSRLVQGIVRAHASDQRRLEAGLALFDDLYESFRQTAVSSRKSR